MKCDQAGAVSGACPLGARSSGTGILGGARYAIGRLDTEDKHRDVWLAGLHWVGPACGESYLTFLLAFSLS